ncbi:hypothetical protein EV421DRAFT_876136 [Armillaria borealis]|uniref:DUF6535 domain-containing protein n=1 Tax=Armillaria borealis TaxID=47425 RepID=A0AA39MMC6_9AGAR|nr:hypothetical protein EV421DRAFT_876136 [Armillaria borealis]
MKPGNIIPDGNEEGGSPSVDIPTNDARGRRRKAKRFGLRSRRRYARSYGVNTSDYEQKYPEDAMYEEAGPYARVWRTYQDETQIHDTAMVEDSRDSVDVLLVFAGLFSAVVTTFVVQTSQNLQLDFGEVSASLLFELVLIQRAVASGVSIDQVPGSRLTPTTIFSPVGTTLWVNGLWFISLSLSLVTALIAVLVKQWLHQYMSIPPGTPRDHSLLRHYRFMGLEAWHVPIIIGLLPVLMYIALAFFFLGLVVFLVPLNIAIALVVAVIGVVSYTAYVASNILPLCYSQCPYKTPLSNILTRLVRRRLRPVEYTIATTQHVATDALQWLFTASSNPTVQHIVLQSLGGIPGRCSEYLSKELGRHRYKVVPTYLHMMQELVETNASGEYVLKQEEGSQYRLERLLRSLFLTGILSSSPFTQILANLKIPHWTSFELQTILAICQERHQATVDLPLGSTDIFLQDTLHLHPAIWAVLLRYMQRTLPPIVGTNEDNVNWNLCLQFVRMLTQSPSTITVSDTVSITIPAAMTFRDAVRNSLVDNEVAVALLKMFIKFDVSKDNSLSILLRLSLAMINLFSGHTTVPQPFLEPDIIPVPSILDPSLDEAGYAGLPLKRKLFSEALILLGRSSFEWRENCAAQRAVFLTLRQVIDTDFFSQSIQTKGLRSLHVQVLDLCASLYANHVPGTAQFKWDENSESFLNKIFNVLYMEDETQDLALASADVFRHGFLSSAPLAYRIFQRQDGFRGLSSLPMDSKVPLHEGVRSRALPCSQTGHSNGVPLGPFRP